MQSNLQREKKRFYFDRSRKSFMLFSSHFFSTNFVSWRNFCFPTRERSIFCCCCFWTQKFVKQFGLRLKNEKWSFVFQKELKIETEKNKIKWMEIVTFAKNSVWNSNTTFSANISKQFLGSKTTSVNFKKS